MRWTYWLVCIGGLLGGASPTLYADHYNVFLIAGQSNCDGRGPANDLKGPLARWAKPQQDVIISYSCSTLRGPQLTSGGFQPLQPGWSVAPGKNKPKMLPSSTFGPEVSFGRTMADHLQKEKIALIKFAEGGTSLAKDWNPELTDRLYVAFLDFTRKQLAALKSQGHTYTIRGMIWHQGESDAGLPEGEYEKHLTKFITRIRTDLVCPELLFGIGEVFDNGKRDLVRAGQKAAADKLKGAFLVSAAELSTYDMGTHFDAASMITLGEGFARGMIQAMQQP